MATKKRFFVRLGKGSEAIEGPLNFFGYIPIVGSISAMIRILFAHFQIFVGCVGLVVGAFARLVGEAPKKGKKPSHMYFMAEDGLNYVGHGFLNWGRSLIEFIPFLPLLLCLPYDRKKVKILDYAK